MAKRKISLARRVFIRSVCESTLEGVKDHALDLNEIVVLIGAFTGTMASLMAVVMNRCRRSGGPRAST